VQNGNCVDTTKIIPLGNGVKVTGDSIYAYYCPKDSLALLIADTNGNTNIKWHPDRLVLHDTITVSVTGDSARVLTQLVPYCYITYKHNGCPDTARTIISVLTYDAFRPNELVNVFSPNGDKTNDFFYPFYQQGLNQYQIYKQADTYELHIYDRWGKSVYDATDYAKPWDGKTKSGHDADAGSYFFIVKYKSNCGSNADLVEKKGFVELVR
jgi:gliding motility-associated-like protein